MDEQLFFKMLIWAWLGLALVTFAVLFSLKHLMGGWQKMVTVLEFKRTWAG
jgi:hypothetical protein